MRYRIVQNNAFEKYRKTTQSIIKNAKNEVKQALKEDKTVNLSNKQVVQISSQINNGLVSLGTDAMKAYQSTLKDIVLKVKSAGDLKEQLGKHIKSGLNIGVTYKDGKTYQFDNYWEMKARTDIQQEIGNNMISTGQENGIIFYITSFYGDCAPDHAEYQGKIYVDEKWESMAPKDRLDEIRDYINSNKLLTVQEVTQNPPFLTTRPNCRHYFQYIDIDSVLGAKTKDDVNALRQERDLNFGGKYKPDKYKALQQQRQNERKIREYKADMEKKELSLALEPGNKQLQSEIEIDKSNIRMYQKAQRDLAKQYSNIERRYDREKVGNRIDFGGNNSKEGNVFNFSVDLTDTEKNTLINNKLEPKPIGNNVNEHEDENNKTQRIEHSRDFAVDYTIIEARKYNNKVLNMVEGNLDDKRNIYSEIKDMLKHRSGTNGEDLIVYNLKTKELYVANKSTIPSGVEPDEQALDLINKDPQNVITIHNHPESLPPSINDLNALVERKQLVGFVATHDGRIYRYTKPKAKIEGTPLARVIDKVRLLRYDEEKERIELLKRLKVLYDFEFEEVLD